MSYYINKPVLAKFLDTMDIGSVKSFADLAGIKPRRFYNYLRKQTKSVDESTALYLSMITGIPMDTLWSDHITAIDTPLFYERAGRLNIKADRKYRYDISYLSVFQNTTPFFDLCGFCGKKIEDAKLLEIRPTGNPSKGSTEQAWYFHPECWKFFNPDNKNYQIIENNEKSI